MTNERKRSPLRILAGFALIFIGLVQLGFQSITYSTSSDVEYTYEISRTEYAEGVNAYLQDEGIQTPLALQTDERWANESYGLDGEQTIAENGCAPASLAMVLAYYEQRTVSPTEITDWAQNQYYVTGSGTDWSIFEAFAKEHNLTFHDLGADFTKAQTYLEQDIPVVVSAAPGEFTDNGHIMVLARYQEEEDNLTILDPNDDADKSHAYTWFTAGETVSQFRHYWAFTQDEAV